jgi:hypothetical protein
MFRIYAGKDNKPAEYSADNVPYVPKKSLSISLDGTTSGDFTMVFGFPGRTTEYLHSAAVQQIVEVSDPAKVAIRDKALAAIDGFMRKDELIKIQYAAKYASISNAWKKWQGEILGLTRTNAVGKKKSYEATFQQRVNANPKWKDEYGTLLGDLESAYTEIKPYALARDYFNEIVGRIELFTIAAQLNTLITAYEKDGESGYNKRLTVVKSNLQNLYEEYNSNVDQKVFESLMKLYQEDQEAGVIAPEFKELVNGAGGNYQKLGSTLYQNTNIDEPAILQSLEKSPAEVVGDLKSNQAIILYNQLLRAYQERVQTRVNEVQSRINQLQRIYMKAQMEVMKEKKFYPDANSTLRVTYGQVNGYNARDGVKFDTHTYLDGVIEKYVPGDYEFDVPEKLKELYQKKDYGQYGKNGKMPVCFIASNHTTGGNSGSPALDAYGNLVGLNFDRVWEGTMSDINYDPSICRNIMVDIRYVLFIVDKYAGANHLIKEMKLVHPKKK